MSMRSEHLPRAGTPCEQPCEEPATIPGSGSTRQLMECFPLSHQPAAAFQPDHCRCI